MNMITPLFFLENTTNSDLYVGLPDSGVAYVCFHKRPLKKVQEKYDLIEIEFPHGTLYRNKNNTFWLLYGANHPSRASMAAEALYALGITTTKAFGVAGSLNSELDLGNLYSISEALSLDGLAKLYNLPFKITTNSKKENSVCVASITNIYRETKELINDLREQNVSLIDMEAYAFFAAANFYKVNHEHNFAISDILINEGWEYNEQNFSKALELVSEYLIKEITDKHQ